ncbi:hypothetical protein BGZ73_006607 [Actinomortierella ambigua]|nr:hypothetical protein BGZ73_006607 [Actinomortierella ambigua]
MSAFIGVGGYGNVYHAQWEGRKVAIKKFAMTHTEAVKEGSIQREVQLLDSLRDKHIIQFYGTTHHEGRLVLVMEYAEGGSLHRAINQRRLDWPTKTRIAQEIVRGLAYIHHKKVVHRDLKSMNVLLTRHMEVKLCDFGLATIKVRSASMSTALRGTFRWMAPELFTSRPEYSTKSDMYALAMVMWEMAANCTTPFQDQLDNFTVMAIVMRGERENLPDDTPPEYRMWVERCWDHDPANRPEASEMVTKDEEPALELESCSDRSTVSITSDLSRMGISFSSTSSSSNDLSLYLRRPSDATVFPPSNGSTTSALLPRANAGDTDAQVTLAAMYEKGVGVQQSDTEAFKWYLRAAAQGSTEAQYKTGDCFFTGRGTPKDYGVSIYWTRLAAEKGHPKAQGDLGWMYRNGVGVERNYDEAVAWYQKSAAQGNSMAQNNLGRMYQNGFGVDRDDVTAVAWFRRSAAQGNADAQNNLGWMYQNGFGVVRDYVEAVVWYRRSAEQGNAPAQFSLGRMYQNGLGVERDFELAGWWYRQSAEQGNALAQLYRGRMYEKGLGVTQDYDEAVWWYRKSAEKGNAEAQNSLGWFYQNGYGVERDYDEAVSWYRKSADQGDPVAQNNLGWMYDKGFGVERDYRKAVSWYRKSAERGNPKAQYNLGMNS